MVSSKLNKYLFFISGTLIFSYIILRASFLEPLHDEVATFFHFIESGNIWGDKAPLDANNHLINSFWGRFMYLIFNENYFSFRFLSVISFPFYYIGVWKITYSIEKNEYKWLVLIGLISIPWILDYFSYSRGYSVAISAFIWCLIFAQKFVKTEKIRYLFFLVFCLLFCVASSLIYLVSSGLLIAYVTSYFLFFKSKKEWVLFSIGLGIYVLGILPLINFSLELKNSGALYYGSLDGFWNVTLRTLIQNVFFVDYGWIKYLILLFGIIFCLIYLYQNKKNNIKSTLQLSESLLGFLIIGNVILILFLAKVMKVNYPEDRAGMYFIPLSLLFVGIVLSKNNHSSKFLYLFLFFPVSLIYQMNFNTSVFSPEERMSLGFYKKIQKYIKKDYTVSVYPIQGLTYASFEKNNSKTIKHIAKNQRWVRPYCDVLITKKSMLFPKNNLVYYKQIAYHKESNHIAYIRKNPFQKLTLLDTIKPDYLSNNEFISIFEGNIQKDWLKTPMELLISGEIILNENYNVLSLVVTTEKINGEVSSYESVNLRWYFGENQRKITLLYPYIANYFLKNESKLKIYIWNPSLIKVNLKHAQVKFISLKYIKWR